jgi:hypothetical protein
MHDVRNDFTTHEQLFPEHVSFAGTVATAGGTAAALNV